MLGRAMTVIRSTLLIGLVALAGCISKPDDTYILPVKGTADSQALGEGLLLSSEKPLKVVAARGGQVIEVSGKRGEDRTVIVDHGGGVHTTYSNLSKVSVARGAWVKAGRKIGKVSKGENDLATFGFEMSLAGTQIDPLMVINAPDLELKEKPPVKVRFEDEAEPKKQASDPAYPPGYDKYGPIPGYKGPGTDLVSSGPQEKSAEGKYPPGHDKYGPIPGWKP
ncbi:M23 family metallopeptidase [Parvularcula lutaonensis]|uniref:Peptidoglycan DD-metalloendopeptidase family protein n=1 Tax=Parvularcula lutaonensis TaxID=491923 RepID=A0ABV7MGM4_9PROT|nr:M23 family metallopeptidase [Parvularcula lutaonensis]